MQVNYNISAMIANNALVANDNKLAASIERLSSGLKIANAKDNPSGLAISRRMNAQIKSLGVAGGNSGDGISVIQTADGTLSEVHDILQRMSELAIQAANGTNSKTDLSIIQDEIGQLKEEITRISEATEFNGQVLLDGTFDLRGYATIKGETDPEITVNSYSDVMDFGNYYIDGIYCEYDKETGKVTLLDEEGYKINTTRVDVHRITEAQGRKSDETYMYQADVTVDGDIVKIATRDGREIEIKINRDFYEKDENGKPKKKNDKLVGERISLDLTSKGAMTMQVGANEGQTLDIRIPKVTLTNLGIAYTDVSRTYEDDLNDFTTYIKSNTYIDDADKMEILGLTYYEWEENDWENGKININKDIKDEYGYSFLNAEDGRKIVEAYRKVKEGKETERNFDAEEAAEIAAIDPQNVLDVDTEKEAIHAKYEALRNGPDPLKKKGVSDIIDAARERTIVAPHSGADQAIEDIGTAIQKVSDIRSRLGAYQNRLEHTVNNINVTSENMTAAYSRIMDVDMAEEMTVYTTQQVLSQAGTSMLAQANERPQQVLQLLQ
ncbi:flagellin N-terminal helical domain-containing protein [Butyrivibrio sp. AE3004]|uniref:flagellin N-terminal helical domain-containing protein n=1 Tax=Butyrivibrio sp. AE3004 TaxID=1506994 RepID=UPI00068FF54F|nr:flagellin [Butyrivibrio sp. AE3004]